MSFKYEYTENDLADIPCPVCQHHASILNEEEGSQQFKPCEHLVFVYLPEVGDYEYQLESWLKATESMDLEDYDSYEEHFERLHKKSKFSQSLHIIENESGGMACGPGSFTEIYAYAVEESLDKDSQDIAVSHDETL